MGNLRLLIFLIASVWRHLPFVAAPIGYLAFAGPVHHGLVMGVLLLEVVAKLLPAQQFFRNPGVDFTMAIGATLMIVVAGAFAGYIPARRAANIRPVIALHDE